MEIAAPRIALLAVCTIAAGFAGEARASELSDAAANLQPGEWAEFSANGWGGSLLDACDGSHSILEWANKAVWNPIKKQVHFIGQGHFACAKYIVYDEATNTWETRASLPNGVGEAGHAYEHNSIDPRNGDFYYRNYNSHIVERYNEVTQSWSQLPNVNADSHQVAGAIAVFPEANGILLVDGDWGVHFFDFDSEKWSLVANTQVITDESKPQLEMGSLNNFATYNHVYKAVYFGGGGGSKTFYKFDMNKNLQTLASPPVSIGIKSAMSVAEPSTGVQLVFADDGSMYEYDHAANQWLSGGSHPVMDNANDWRISVGIPDHGVTMFMTWNFDDSKILLYRHAPGSITTPVTFPNSPDNLLAN